MSRRRCFPAPEGREGIAQGPRPWEFRPTLLRPCKGRTQRPESPTACALRVTPDSRGATFEAFLQPSTHPPGEAQLGHMGLCAAQLAAGKSLATVRAEFAAFAGAAPTLAAWGPNTLTLARRVLACTGPQVVLKRCYCNLRNASSGLLDDVMAREGLTAAAMSCHGRARARLGNALALAQWLRAIQAERHGVSYDE